MYNTLKITRPDDWHLHLRDGDMLKGILPETTRHFGRAIIMPNLVPPVITSNDAKRYRERILAACPHGTDFKPLMTLYLTDKTDPNDVALAFSDGLINAVKYYRVLNPLRISLPELKTTSEHITTKNGVDYVKSQPKNHAASITTHHLIINRNHLLVGGIKPHYYCLPVAKREEHRLAVRNAATSGDKRFFLGTDSAPHTDPNKETGCGCAGCFTATNTMSLLAHVFDEDDALENLEKFTSLNGPKHYGLKPNNGTIVLEKSDEPVQFPEKIHTNDGPVTVFNPGQEIFWKVKKT